MARIRPSPHGSQKREQAWIFLPPNRYNIELKVNVVTASNGTIDLMSYNNIPFVMNISTTGRSLRKGYGEATVILQNAQGTFNKIITGGETIDIIAEYTDGTPSNNIFPGKIDGTFKMFDMSNGFQMKLVCRQVPEVQDKLISEKAEDLVAHSFITQIIDNNFDGILTTTNMSTGMVTLLNRNYVFKPGSKVVTEVFDKAGFTGYIDENNDIHSWSLTDPEKNSVEYIAWGINCNAVMPFGTDLRKTKNNIIVTGDRAEGGSNLFYIWSKKDSDNISTYWQKDILLNDNSLTEQTSIENDTDLSYDMWVRTDQVGGMNSVYGLETLKPGQAIRCQIPYCEIKDWFIINELTHNITPTNGSWTTSVRIERFGTNLIDLLKVRDEKTRGNILASLNPNGMVGGFLITFNEASEQVIHNNTEIVNGELVLQTGFGTGDATTILKNVDEDITKVEVRLVGSDLGSTTVDVTVDNEESYDENVGVNTLNSFAVTSTSANKKRLRFKINLVVDSDNPTPTVQTALCLFKFD